MNKNAARRIMLCASQTPLLVGLKSDEPDTLPVPDAVAEHDVNEPSAPPCGTDSENVMLLPDTLPDTDPFAFVPVPLSVNVSVPENEVPD